MGHQEESEKDGYSIWEEVVIFCYIHTLFLVLILSLQLAVCFVYCHCSLLARPTGFNPGVDPNPH